MTLLAKYTAQDIVFGGFVQLITLPYHRFFTYNTLRPAQEVQKHATLGVESGSSDRIELYAVIVGWRVRKKDELGFVALAATVLTAIITASFSWPNVADSHWVGPAFWYASLSTSICGIFLSAQQLTLLSLIGDLPEGPNTPSAAMMRRHLSQILYEKKGPRGSTPADGEAATVGSGSQWVLSWRQVFAWQCPMMFIAYSTVFYMVGLTVVVCTPLIWEDWGPNSYMAVAYIASMGLSWGLFAFCSLGGYRKISLHDSEDDEDQEAENFRAGTRDIRDESKAETASRVAEAEDRN
ncbi:hypothetical protein B0T22DRAFT_462978 [Podospora appendiculata]|uniref:Uncharacterized protein n=1 Tax=Podospora appendiculata TaxID=314037 RepID=A0AAE1CE01_9PEZI|nr:hypothetical protein B0T22DRAFT_462978 [Podospora appendiculata]